MARQGPRDREPTRAVTAERAARLVQLVQLLATGPQAREVLQRRLKLDVRSFYRDLELVRSSGVGVPFVDKQYQLTGTEAAAVALLPFPDPRLRLGEALLLSQGRGAVHKKLRGLVARITQPSGRKRGPTAPGERGV